MPPPRVCHVPGLNDAHSWPALDNRNPGRGPRQQRPVTGLALKEWVGVTDEGEKRQLLGVAPHSDLEFHCRPSVDACMCSHWRQIF